jgi:hypothetical protein
MLERLNLGLNIGGRCREVGAIRRWSYLSIHEEVNFFMTLFDLTDF